MTSSDSRSALPHFVVGCSGYRAGRSQSTPPLAPERSHCWGGDGSLLFPRRLSHHSTSLTPPGSSGLHLQALHPFHGLRPLYPGSAPGWSLAGSPNDAAGFALCCGLVGCTFLKEGSTPRFDARISPHAGGLLQRDLAPPLTGLAPVSRREPQDARRVGDWRGGRFWSGAVHALRRRRCGPETAAPFPASPHPDGRDLSRNDVGARPTSHLVEWQRTRPTSRRRAKPRNESFAAHPSSRFLN